MTNFVHNDEDFKPQHAALNQLDEWRAEAKDVVESNPTAHVHRVDELPDAIRKELLRNHRDDIEVLLEKLKSDKETLDDRMHSDEPPGVSQTQEDLDELDALTEAIEVLEDLLKD